MKTETLKYPIGPVVLISVASLTGIILGVLPYIKKDLIQTADILQYALLGCGTVCLLTALLILYRISNKPDKRMPVEEKERTASSAAAPPPPRMISREGNDQAVLLISLLQEKGRFLDFVMGDITAYSDGQIGAAARVVHQGCNELIKGCFSPEAINTEKECSEVTLHADYNPSEYKIIGDVIGDPPYNGKLVHKGWKANHVKLPQLSLPQSQSERPVLQRAEIEL